MSWVKPGLNMEIIIREQRNRLDTYKCSSGDFYKISKILFQKYGIKAFVNDKKSKDLSWLKKT